MATIFDSWDELAAARKRTGSTGSAPIPASTGTDGQLHAWATAILSGCAQDVANAPAGTRNDTLNRAALRCHRVALTAGMDPDHVDRVLGDADGGAGHPATARTLRSAREAAGNLGAADPPAGHTTDDPFGPGIYTGRLRLATSTGVPPWQQQPGELPEGTAEAPESNGAPPDGPLAIRARPIDWHALWADTSRDDWILEPLLPARRAVTIYSAPKVGKSLLALEVAAGVSRGAQVLGTQPDRARRVLYVDFENDPRGDIRTRLQAMRLGPGDLDGLVYLSYPDFAAFDTDRGGQQLAHLASEHQCEVVVIDTMSRAVEGPENENDTWLQFYSRTGLPLKQAGITLLRLDHSGKDTSKGQRGGSAKSGDVDAVWHLSRINDDTYRLECTDSRMMIQPQDRTLVLHRRADPLRHDVDGRGYLAGLETEVADRVRVADEAGLPDNANRDQIRAALTTAWDNTERRPGRNDLLGRVVAARQQRIPAALFGSSPTPSPPPPGQSVRDGTGTSGDDVAA